MGVVSNIVRMLVGETSHQQLCFRLFKGVVKWFSLGKCGELSALMCEDSGGTRHAV